MADFKKSFEENYLKFISIAAGVVVLIAIVIWVSTVFFRRVNN